MGVAMESTVTIRGNVGNVPTFKGGESDGRKWVRCDFRLGSTRRVRRPTGEWVDAGTTWITVEAWGVLAEGISYSVLRGDPVIVTGRLRTDEWADTNGQMQSRLILAAETVGHDLARGRARFVRNVQVPMPDAPAQDESSIAVSDDYEPVSDEESYDFDAALEKV